MRRSGRFFFIVPILHNSADHWLGWFVVWLGCTASRFGITFTSCRIMDLDSFLLSRSWQHSHINCLEYMLKQCFYACIDALIQLGTCLEPCSTLLILPSLQRNTNQPTNPCSLANLSISSKLTLHIRSTLGNCQLSKGWVFVFFDLVPYWQIEHRELAFHWAIVL